MEKLCRYVAIPCVLVRMLLVSTVFGGLRFYAGDGLLWSLGFALASLVLMQIGYFAVVIIMVARQRRGRD